ncbi:MAG: hypothetical protein WKF54_01925 [Nocardioidaceae bacterium]
MRASLRPGTLGNSDEYDEERIHQDDLRACEHRDVGSPPRGQVLRDGEEFVAGSRSRSRVPSA